MKKPSKLKPPLPAAKPKALIKRLSALNKLNKARQLRDRVLGTHDVNVRRHNPLVCAAHDRRRGCATTHFTSWMMPCQVPITVEEAQADRDRALSGLRIEINELRRCYNDLLDSPLPTESTGYRDLSRVGRRSSFRFHRRSQRNSHGHSR